jgi:hypothetical protein
MNIILYFNFTHTYFTHTYIIKLTFALHLLWWILMYSAILHVIRILTIRIHLLLRNSC